MGVIYQLTRVSLALDQDLAAVGGLIRSAASSVNDHFQVVIGKVVGVAPTARTHKQYPQDHVGSSAHTAMRSRFSQTPDPLATCSYATYPTMLYITIISTKQVLKKPLDRALRRLTFDDTRLTIDYDLVVFILKSVRTKPDRQQY